MVAEPVEAIILRKIILKSRHFETSGYRLTLSDPTFSNLYTSYQRCLRRCAEALEVDSRNENCLEGTVLRL